MQINTGIDRRSLHALRPGTVAAAPCATAALATCESELTYDHLAQAACAVLKGGESAILDATPLQRADRLRFLDLALHLQVDCILVSTASW